MELFKLLGTIAINNSDANKSLSETSSAAKKMANDVEDSAASSEKAGSKWGSAFKKIGAGAVAVGKTVAVGLGAAATALGGLTVKALDAAGELEQNMGGSEAVFKEHATKMQETAKTAFSNMGLSQSDFLATANKMGALFQGAGFSIEESANLSSDAMQRAADVASIMGLDTEAAMEAIAGAAKGNFTMMDNLGVAMNDTAIEAYALSKGIEKSTADMTQQEKIGLAMEMFMEKTAYAAGNYAKENETLAGSLGTAKAALTNFISGAGSVDDVVSSFSNAANVIVRNINELFPKLMTGITELVNQIVPLIPPLLEQLLPGLIQGATGLINGLVAAMPQIVTALLAAVPALLEGITQIINALIIALPSIIQALVSALPTLIPALINGLVSMIVTLCENFAQIIQPIIDYLPEIIISIVDALMDNLPALIQGVVQLVMGLVAALPQILQAVWEVIVGVFKNLPQWFRNIFDSIVNVIGSIFPGAKDRIVAVWNAIKDFITTVVNAIKNVITTVWNAVKNAISSVMNGIKNTVSSIWNGIKSTISSVVNGIKNTVSSVFNGIKSVATSVWNGIKTAITKPIEKARDTIKGIVDKIKGFFSGMKLEFPKIKMPHFGIKPKGWKIGDLLEGSIPKLSIDWYAKAMNNPMVMTKPTIFGYNPETGQLRGGGESGSELVGGTNTVMGMIQAAVASQNETLVYYLQKIIEVLSAYFPQLVESMDRDIVMDSGALVGALAVPMNTALGKLSNRKERGR